MRRIDGGSDFKKSKIFENRDFLMIFGSWARLGLGIPPPGASEAQRHCGPAAEPGESAGGPRDPGRPPTLPVVRGGQGELCAGPGPARAAPTRGGISVLFFKKT